MTSKSFFSFELCKPCGNMKPRSSPAPGLSFAKLQKVGRGNKQNPTLLPPQEGYLTEN